jgi:ComF family protein
MAAAYGSYAGGLRELIHLLKDEQVRPAANVLGRMLAEVIAGLATGMAGDSVLVVPVPLHAKTLCRRGFNQSELMARTALKLLRDDRYVLRADLVQRTRETRSQTGLSGPERRDNIRGAFAVGNAQELGESEVLLLDDVLITGTTASECARILRRAGAARVWVATVARTLKLDVARAERLEEDDARLAMAAHG